jgi:uncharacterized phage protein (TIGR01671 family)
MRECKYRAWDKVNKKMYNVERLYFKDGIITHVGIDCENLKNEIQVIDIKMIELMQYTCLKDKDGKEIYEGDIVECFGENFEVIYDNCKFILKGFYCGCFDVPNDAFSEGIGCMRIIGDKYRNPEYLEVKS